MDACSSPQQKPTAQAALHPEDSRLAFDLVKITDVLWTITDRCNLACPYCVVVPHGRPAPPEPTRAQVDRVLDELHRLPGLESLILSGGEALLSPHIEYILQQSTSLAPVSYLITNGTTVTQKQRSILLAHRPRVMVSIDSLDAASNASTRGSGSLEKSIATLDWLLSEGFFTIVILVFSRSNAAHIEKTLSGLYDRGVRRMLIQQLHCTDPSMRAYFQAASPSPQEIRRLADFIEHFRLEHPDVCIDDNEVCFFERRAGEKARKCQAGMRYLPQRLFMCGAAFNFFALKRNGDVIPCNAFLDCVAGNIYEQDIETIMVSSPVMVGLRRLRQYRVDVVPECGGCELNPICDGGCRADVYHLTGEIGNRHPNCPAFA